MPSRKRQPLCEIVFGQLRIPVFNMERGKKVIEGIFMIGETLQGKAKTKGRRRGRRKARGARPGVTGKRAAKARRIERIARMKEKGMTNTEIARKVGVSLVTVAKDLKEAKKEE